MEKSRFFVLSCTYTYPSEYFCLFYRDLIIYFFTKEKFSGIPGYYMNINNLFITKMNLVLNVLREHV